MPNFVATDVYALFNTHVEKSTTRAVYTMCKKTSDLVADGFPKWLNIDSVKINTSLMGKVCPKPETQEIFRNLRDFPRPERFPRGELREKSQGWNNSIGTLS